MNFLFFLKASVFELGITVSIVGFLIVFFSLSLLVVVFNNIPTILKVNFRRRKKSDEKVATPRETSIEGNVTAAISLALHIYLSEMHDEESNIVTIKQIRKAYSPWSSKIYSVTQNWPKY